MRLIVGVVALVVCACGPTQNARHYRVVLNAALKTLPEECRATVPAGPNSMEQMVASFCSAAQQQQGSYTYSSEGVVTEELWTIFEAEGEAYLVTSPVTTGSGVPSPRSAIRGNRSGNKYSFVSAERYSSKSCVPDQMGGPPPTVCGGACTTTYSDRNNCGGCGVVCAANQACMSGNCQVVTVNCSMPGTCAGAQVNLATDPNNCGYCGRTCPNMACSPSPYGPPSCVPPYASQCSPPTTGEPPMALTREQSTRLEFDVSGPTLRGTMTGVTTYSCESPRCLSDFGSRCPSCTQSSPVVGTQATDVQQVEFW